MVVLAAKQCGCNKMAPICRKEAILFAEQICQRRLLHYEKERDCNLSPTQRIAIRPVGDTNRRNRMTYIQVVSSSKKYALSGPHRDQAGWAYVAPLLEWMRRWIRISERLSDGQSKIEIQICVRVKRRQPRR